MQRSHESTVHAPLLQYIEMRCAHEIALLVIGNFYMQSILYNTRNIRGKTGTRCCHIRTRTSRLPLARVRVLARASIHMTKEITLNATLSRLDWLFFFYIFIHSIRRSHTRGTGWVQRTRGRTYSCELSGNCATRSSRLDLRPTHIYIYYKPRSDGEPDFSLATTFSARALSPRRRFCVFFSRARAPNRCFIDFLCGYMWNVYIHWETGFFFYFDAEFIGVLILLTLDQLLFISYFHSDVVCIWCYCFFGVVR